MADDMLREILRTTQECLQSLANQGTRLEAVEREVHSLAQVIHKGNGRDSVMTRLAQVETYTKESRARLIKAEATTTDLDKDVEKIRSGGGPAPGGGPPPAASDRAAPSGQDWVLV